MAALPFRRGGHLRIDMEFLGDRTAEQADRDQQTCQLLESRQDGAADRIEGRCASNLCMVFAERLDTSAGDCVSINVWRGMFWSVYSVDTRGE